MPCRRSAPSLLFTAIAATIVMLPWAINGLPGDDTDKQPAEAPQVAQQPLTGLGGGETIREVHQDSPFSMVAVTAGDLTGTRARVRAKKPDGSWGPWYDAETLEGVGPDSAVQSIEIDYPERTSLTDGTESWALLWFVWSMKAAGWLGGLVGLPAWLVYWFVVSLVAAFCFRRVLKVNV